MNLYLSSIDGSVKNQTKAIIINIIAKYKKHFSMNNVKLYFDLNSNHLNLPIII